jgi:hypothetical protein
LQKGEQTFVLPPFLFGASCQWEIKKGKALCLALWFNFEIQVSIVLLLMLGDLINSLNKIVFESISHFI